MPGPQSDARLDAVRAVFARHVPEPKRMLNCLALVEPRWFPTAYADWQGMVELAASKIGAAGYDAATVSAVVDQARPADLMQAVDNRQAAIADCVANTDWMQRYASLSWYLTGDIDRALETAP